MNNPQNELSPMDSQAANLGACAPSTRGRKEQLETFARDPAMVNVGTGLGDPASAGREVQEMIRAKAGRNIILFGPPGVGKGVQASLLIKEQGLSYLSTGDAIRDEIRRRTAIGQRLETLIAQGRFADDVTVLSMVASRLDSPGFRAGFIMDGFPRTVTQAEMFDRMLEERGRSVDLALFLRAPAETILARLAGRLVCDDCGQSYHSAFRRPRVDGVCDTCAGTITRRKDDDPDVYRRRLELYFEETAPLEEYYARTGVLANIDGDHPVAEVASKIRRAVHTAR